MSGKAQNEHITSGFPATADMQRTSRGVRFVPQPDSCSAANLFDQLVGGGEQ